MAGIFGLREVRTEQITKITGNRLDYGYFGGGEGVSIFSSTTRGFCAIKVSSKWTWLISNWCSMFI